MPNPARIEVVPLLPGEYAIPRRGAQLFLGARGALNNSGWLMGATLMLGVFDRALRAWRASLSGTVVYS